MVRKFDIIVKFTPDLVCNSDTTDRYRRLGRVRLDLKLCPGKYMSDIMDKNVGDCWLQFLEWKDRLFGQ